MTATHFDVSLTTPSVIGLGQQVTLETSMRVARPDSTEAGRMSGRRFPPYVQDPPIELDENDRQTSI